MENTTIVWRYIVGVKENTFEYYVKLFQRSTLESIDIGHTSLKA
jgi:hypothetical protein